MNKKALTLIEMMVAAAISTIIIVGISNYLIMTYYFFNSGYVHSAIQSGTLQIIREISSDIRNAYSLEVYHTDDSNSERSHIFLIDRNGNRTGGWRSIIKKSDNSSILLKISDGSTPNSPNDKAKEIKIIGLDDAQIFCRFKSNKTKTNTVEISVGLEAKKGQINLLEDQTKIVSYYSTRNTAIDIYTD